jgi:hypothetical protein
VTDSKDTDLRKISSIYDEEGIEEVMGESKPFELNSLPIAKVTITAGGEGVATSEFIIKKGDMGTVVDTSDGGKYTRFKLKFVTSAVKDKEKGLPADAVITAHVAFEGAMEHSVTLTLDNAEFETGDSIPAKCWKQLGGTVDKLVVQIGFERVPGDNSYKIGSNVFISQPVFEGAGIAGAI